MRANAPTSAISEEPRGRRGRRALTAVLTLVFTGLCTWYIVDRIDFETTRRVLTDARLGPLALALALLIVALFPLAWRWQVLLRLHGTRDSLGWLLRAYFVSYTAGQVLPTALGGDATRIFEASRRHRGATATIASSVIVERGLGAAATLLLGGVGFLLAIGRYDVGPYVWLELAIVVATVAVAVAFFSPAAGRRLRRLRGPLERVRLGRALASLYRGIHAYGRHPRVTLSLLGLTVVVQAARVLTIWLAAEAAGVDLSPLPFFVMGPLFFLVMLAPFTINGFALREAFFVSFLGQLGVPADRAFAAGFLYFLLSIALAAPGAAILLGEGVRGLVRPDGTARRRTSG